MNLEQARFNMIEQQIRPWNVLDETVLELLTLIKREEFLPVGQRPLAFIDTELPLADGSLMLSPKMEARIVQEVAVKKHEKVLVVGAGTGYLPALLAAFARQVVCVESSIIVHAAASMNLQHQGVSKVKLEVGDAAKGWNNEAPYDVIVMTGSLSVLPEEIKHQLSIGGRLFVILGVPPVMTAYIVTRVRDTEFNFKSLFETNVAAVPRAERQSKFLF